MQNDCAYITKSSSSLVPWWKRLVGKAADYSETGTSAGWCEPQNGEAVGIKSILVPTDFTPSSVEALAEAVRLGRRFRATITLLHVVDVNFHVPPTGPVDANKLKAELWQDGLGKLGQTVLGLAGMGVDVQTLIRQGLPWEEIVDAARQHDLVVIGQHKPTPFWHLFSRQTVKGVLEAAPCPVILVREQVANPKTEARNLKELQR